jgi:acylphosphatase
VAAAAVRYRIRGRVQGVGFRWFVMREGSRLHLGGYVRNLPDGSVEVVAQGEAGDLARLERALERGPTMARVDGVEKSDVAHDFGLTNSFDIR